MTTRRKSGAAAPSLLLLLLAAMCLSLHGVAADGSADGSAPTTTECACSCDAKDCCTQEQLAALPDCADKPSLVQRVMHAKYMLPTCIGVGVVLLVGVAGGVAKGCRSPKAPLPATPTAATSGTPRDPSMWFKSPPVSLFTAMDGDTGARRARSDSDTSDSEDSNPGAFMASPTSTVDPLVKEAEAATIDQSRTDTESVVERSFSWLSAARGPGVKVDALGYATDTEGGMTTNVDTDVDGDGANDTMTDADTDIEWGKAVVGSEALTTPTASVGFAVSVVSEGESPTKLPLEPAAKAPATSCVRKFVQCPCPKKTHTQ
jgi:hypothetical protein